MWEGRPRHPLTLVSELRQAQVPNARRSPPPWRHPGSAALPWRAHPGRGRRRWCSAARPLSAPCKQWRESHSVWKGVAAVNRALLHTQFLRRAKNKGSVPQRLLLGGGGWLPWDVLCCAPTPCTAQAGGGAHVKPYVVALHTASLRSPARGSHTSPPMPRPPRPPLQALQLRSGGGARRAPLHLQGMAGVTSSHTPGCSPAAAQQQGSMQRHLAHPPGGAAVQR